ncbi:MAG: hypothetical protein WAK29_09485 [Terriglobales bacterium]
MTVNKENDSNETHCTMTVNGVFFEARGTQAEVERKLRAFMNQVFQHESLDIVEDKPKEGS